MFILLILVYLRMNKTSKSIDSKLNLKQPKIDDKSIETARLGSNLKQLTQLKRLTRIKTSPGPGDYNLSSLFNNKKGITIPHEIRKSQLKQIKPDPWSYVPNISIVQPRSPKTTIGREKKLERFINAPGPADYRINYKAIIERSRMPVIGSSRKREEIEVKPGPTDYDTLIADRALKRNITVAIGHQGRDKSSRSNSPAPNQYKIEDQFSLHTKNKFGFTMGSRLRVKTEVDSPSDFLKYNAEKSSILPKAPAFSIKKQKKSNFQLNISPGPAAYSPKSKQRHQSHGITIPHSHRQIYQARDSVGIGTYYIQNETPTPLYSIPRAEKTQNHSANMPGPGQYSPQLPKTQKFKSIGIGYGDKFSFIGKEAPGPGNYNITVKEHREGYTIGHSSRMADWGRQVRPGPADYHTDANIASKFITSKKRK